MNKVIILCGLQGIGKTRYCAEQLPTHERVDIEPFWETAQREGLMWAFEIATWSKIMLAGQLSRLLGSGKEDIVVEMTGMTKTNQAGVRGLVAIAKAYGYEAEIIWLKPRNVSVWRETLNDNPGALSMFAAYRRGEKQFREPTDCPYFESVTTIEVDHSSWSFEKPDRHEEVEHWEVKRD